MKDRPRVGRGAGRPHDYGSAFDIPMMTATPLSRVTTILDILDRGVSNLHRETLTVEPADAQETMDRIDGLITALETARHMAEAELPEDPPC